MSNSNIAPAANDATPGSVLPRRVLIFHCIKTCKHEGRGEPLAIYLAVELSRRLHNPKALQSQRQLLIAELALIHRRHDEFPRLLLPLFVDGLRLGNLIRSFAHCHICSYTGDSIFMDSPSSYTFSLGSLSRDTPC